PGSAASAGWRCASRRRGSHGDNLVIVPCARGAVAASHPLLPSPLGGEGTGVRGSGTGSGLAPSPQPHSPEGRGAFQGSPHPNPSPPRGEGLLTVAEGAGGADGGGRGAGRHVRVDLPRLARALLPAEAADGALVRLLRRAVRHGRDQ